MSWELLGSGDFWDALGIISLEDEIAEGQRGKLSLELTNPLAPQHAAELQSQLDNAGVAEAQVNAYGNYVDVTYRKGVSWLAVIIPIIVVLLIVLAIVIIFWRFFKETPGLLPVSLWALAAIAGATVLGIYLVRRRT